MSQYYGIGKVVTPEGVVAERKKNNQFKTAYVPWGIEAQVNGVVTTTDNHN